MASVKTDRTGKGRWRRKIAVLGGVAAYCLLQAPSSTEPAIANGDTRTLTFINNHTHETGEFTYRANGYYDQAVLEKINWFMRDWRINEQIKMDPRLFDILWEVYRESGSSQPIDVLSAYRSPQTNSMLRRRSRLVAEHSQHMQGKAIDAHFIDVGPKPIRDLAMKMQEGGVGFYPIGSTPWIHVDSGTVRYWPRMNRSSLARLFPDGKTVFIPSDGQPMERYADAKAMIESRGGEVQTASSSGGGLFGWLFGGARGGGADDEEEAGGARVIAGGRGGPPVMMAGVGRGGPAPTMVAEVAKPETHSAPAPLPPPPPPPPVVAAAAPAVNDMEAADAKNPPADPPEAEPATNAVAPLPPHKPAALMASLDLVAPVPPRRPSELTIPATDKKGAAPNSDDLIATLIESNLLPKAITKGVRSTPKSALALAETKPSNGNTDALARASALAPPPLPPVRPRIESGGKTIVEKEPPAPPVRPVKSPRPTAANPYGGLVVDAFNSSLPSSTAKSAAELRGTSP